MSEEQELEPGVTPQRFRAVKLVALLFIFLALLLPLGAIWQNNQGDTGVSVVDMGLEGESSTDFEEDSIALYVQMTGFNPETKRAEMAYFPWPTENLADQFSSSVVGDVPIKLFVDGQNAEIAEFDAGDQIGAVETVVDVLSTRDSSMASDGLYPFDVYEMDGYAQVVADIDGTGYQPVQTFDYFYTTPVPGFNILYERMSAFDTPLGSEEYALDYEKLLQERMEGKISFLAKIERSFAVKSIAVFIYLFAVVTALSTAVITLRVLSGARPASMNAMVWAAASILGVIQLRTVAPGNPRIGIIADNFFFFPSLVIMLACGVVMTYLWSTREEAES